MADQLTGTWVFNDTIDTSQFFSTPNGSMGYCITQNSSPSIFVDFNSNGEDFLGIYFYEAGDIIVDTSNVYYGENNPFIGVSKGWTNESYKTITITSKLSEVTNGGTLLTWLQANAVKQAEPSPTYTKINSFTYHGKQVNNINGKPIRYVHDRRAGADKTYEMVYVLQLAIPQNVTADGTTVSWDAVENATSYAVFADGNEIGTVEGTVTEDALAGTWVFNDTLSKDGVTFGTSFNANGVNSDNAEFSYICWRYSRNYALDFLYGNTYTRGYNFDTSSWSYPAYKTITITSKLSEVTNGETLLAWLQANATKQ